MAERDSLTGMLNLRTFKGLLAREHGLRVRDARGGYAILPVDMDDLKALNDEHGHQAGNRGMTTVASAIQRAIRNTECGPFRRRRVRSLPARCDGGSRRDRRQRIRNHVYRSLFRWATPAADDRERGRGDLPARRRGGGRHRRHGGRTGEARSEVAAAGRRAGGMRRQTRGYMQGFETPASAATLWRALTDPAMLRAWLATEATIEAHGAGGTRRYRACSAGAKRRSSASTPGRGCSSFMSRAPTGRRCPAAR